MRAIIPSHRGRPGDHIFSLNREANQRRARGEKIPNELLPYLAPLGWQHITGDYIWTESLRRDGEGFRPLTTPQSATQADVLDLSA